MTDTTPKTFSLSFVNNGESFTLDKDDFRSSDLKAMMKAEIASLRESGHAGLDPEGMEKVRALAQIDSINAVLRRMLARIDMTGAVKKMSAEDIQDNLDVQEWTGLVEAVGLAVGESAGGVAPEAPAPLADDSPSSP